MPTSPDPRPPLVALRGVSKAFGNGIVALDDVDLAVRPREFLTLLGPSGCGKSTVLRLIAGLASPTRGTIAWDAPARAGAAGQDINQDIGQDISQDIGFVFQEPTLMPWASVADNVALPLRLKGLARDERRARAAQALERVGLGRFAAAYPRELSGGMKMRVSIARALVTGPRLLLMDEPFAALDEITRFRLGNDLLRVWQALGTTVVFVTHSVFESVYLASRVVVMSAHPGRVHAEIDIGAPYPRDEDFRTSADYAGSCRLVSGALRGAMGAHAA